MVVLQKATDLPDPRFPDQKRALSASFTVETWQHCCKKHWFNPKEPWWKTEFGADVLPEIRKGEAISTPLTPAEEQVLAILIRQTRECLERPQVIVCRAVKGKSDVMSQQKNESGKWILVLPSGALSILRGRDNEYRWATCYFPRETAVEKSRRYRWQVTVRHLIRRYLLLPGKPSSVTLPDKNFEVIRRDAPGKLERLREMTFLTPENWGFCGDEPGSPWRGRLPSWPAAEPPQVEKSVKKRRLRPRFRRDEDDWAN